MRTINVDLFPKLHGENIIFISRLMYLWLVTQIKVDWLSPDRSSKGKDLVPVLSGGIVQP